MWFSRQFESGINEFRHCLSQMECTVHACCLVRSSDLVTFLTTIIGLNRPTRTIGPLIGFLVPHIPQVYQYTPGCLVLSGFPTSFPRVIKHPLYGCHQTFIFPNAAIESAFLHSASLHFMAPMASLSHTPLTQTHIHTFSVTLRLLRRSDLFLWSRETQMRFY